MGILKKYEKSILYILSFPVLDTYFLGGDKRGNDSRNLNK